MVRVESAHDLFKCSRLYRDKREDSNNNNNNNNSNNNNNNRQHRSSHFDVEHSTARGSFERRVLCTPHCSSVSSDHNTDRQQTRTMGKSGNAECESNTVQFLTVKTVRLTAVTDKTHGKGKKGSTVHSCRGQSNLKKDTRRSQPGYSKDIREKQRKQKTHLLAEIAEISEKDYRNGRDSKDSRDSREQRKQR